MRCTLVVVCFFVLCAASSEAEKPTGNTASYSVKNKDLLWQLKCVLPKKIVQDRTLTPETIQQTVQLLKRRGGGPIGFHGPESIQFQPLSECLSGGPWTKEQRTDIEDYLKETIRVFNTSASAEELERRLKELRTLVFYYARAVDPEDIRPGVFVDLSSYWEKAAPGNQGEVGACHSFAVLSVVEALMQRDLKKQISLSRRDLFEQHFLSIPVEKHVYATLNRLPKEELRTYGEGSPPEEDVVLLRKNGVCFASTYPYGDAASCEWRQNLGKLRAERTRLGSEGCDGAKLSLEALPEAIQEYTQLILNSGLEEMKKTHEALAANPTCQQERSLVKSWLQDWSLVREEEAEFASLTSVQRTDKILKLLRDGKPVIATFDQYLDLRGYEEDKSQAWHAVILVGYDGEHGEWIVMNSWDDKLERIPGWSVKHLKRFSYFHKK